VLKFPSLRLARQAAETGGTLPAILNAANEVGVQNFLDGEIRFDQIIQLVEETMAAVDSEAGQRLESVLSADQNARSFAENRVHHLP
jgi:1-deoxy-D-xylulose-5-phosphate reductoisomerase